MTYRKWIYEDIMGIAKLEEQCFQDPWNFRMLAESFCSENTRTCAATEDGNLVGYGFLILAGEDADLANIAVDSGFRRRGIAEKILEFLETEARVEGTRRIFLEVRVSNSPAISLYLKSGYTGAYARKRYYGNGEDALVMRKQL